MRKVFVLIAACGTMAAAIALSAQNRPYEQLMKEVTGVCQPEDSSGLAIGRIIPAAGVA